MLKNTLFVGVSLMAMTSTGAFAAEQQPVEQSAQASANEAPEGDTIVTARRRNETSISVPVVVRGIIGHAAP